MVCRILFIGVLFLLLGCGTDSTTGVNPYITMEILSEPVDQLVYEGGIVGFSVSAVGTDLVYSWSKDGVLLDGENLPVLRIEAASADENSLFQCTVTDTVTSVKTSSVKYQILPRPEVESLGGMVKVPAAGITFTMGSVAPGSTSKESPTHQVELSNSYWMDRVPVSRHHYDSVMSAAYPTTHRVMPWSVEGDLVSSATLPANEVSWEDAVLYCNALNSANGYDSIYIYSVFLDVKDSNSVIAQINLSDSVLYKSNGEGGVAVTIEDSIAVIKERVSYSDPQLMYNSIDTTEVVEYTYDTTFNLDDPTQVESITTDTNEVITYDTTWSDTLKIVKTVVPAETLILSGNFDYYLTDYYEVTSKDTMVMEIDSGTYVTEYTIDSVVILDTVEWDLYQEIRTVFSSVAVENVEIDVVGYKGYRLPTEAEWEFAASALSGDDYYWGGMDLIDSCAWYEGNSNGVVQESASKAPNLFGLHDMCGNVWEWCHDYYGNYDKDDVTDPFGATLAKKRVIRGGSYRDYPILLRTAQRGSATPTSKKGWIGFRTVRSLQ